jgi:hypothetical protein
MPCIHYKILMNEISCSTFIAYLSASYELGCTVYHCTVAEQYQECYCLNFFLCSLLSCAQINVGSILNVIMMLGLIC